MHIGKVMGDGGEIAHLQQLDRVGVARALGHYRDAVSQVPLQHDLRGWKIRGGKYEFVKF